MSGPAWELLGLAALLYAGAWVLGAPVGLALRHRFGGSGTPTALLGLTALQVVGWTLLETGGSGIHGVLPAFTLAAVLVGLSLALWSRRSTRNVTSDIDPAEHRRRLRALGGTTVLAILVFLVHAQDLLRHGLQTTGSLQGTDAARFAAIGKHLGRHGFSDAGTIAGFDLGEAAREGFTGAPLVVSWAEWLTRSEAWRIGTPLLMLGTVLVAQALALVLLRLTRLRAAAIVLVANVAIATFTFQLVTWRFGLPQLLAMAVLPAVLLLLADAGRVRTRRDVLRLAPLPLLLAGLLVTLPHLALLGPPVLLVALVVAALCSRSGPAPSLRTLGALVGGLVVMAALVPTRLPVAIDHLCDLAARLGGPPLAGVLPSGLVGFQTGFSATASAGALFASAWLLGESLNGAIHLRRRWTATSSGFVLPGVVVVVLASYALVYFTRGGPTHEQFVWISTFQPLVVVALLAPITARLTTGTTVGPWSRAALVPLAIPLLCLGAGLVNGRTLTRAFAEMPDPDDVAVYAEADPEHPRFEARHVDRSLGALGDAPALVDIDSLDINLATPWDTMWAAALVGDRNVHLISSSDLPATGAQTGIRLVDTNAGAPALAVPLTEVSGRFTLACTGRIGTAAETTSSCLCAWSQNAVLEVSSFLVTLPGHHWQGYAPLWVRGPSKAADILGISWDGSYVSLLHDHWGTPPQFSGHRLLEPGLLHRFDVVIDDGHLAVFVDGGLLLSSPVPTYPEGEVTLGRNDIGASTVPAEFAGIVEAVPAGTPTCPGD